MLVEFAADDPYEIGGLPAPVPGPPDEFLAPAQQLRVGRRVGRQEEAPVSRPASPSE